MLGQQKEYIAFTIKQSNIAVSYTHLRACRFVAKLDFLPTEDLLEAMPKAFHRVSGLSLERVRDEINRLMLEPAVAKGLDVLVQSRLAECSCRVVENGEAREVPILPELYHLVNLPQEKDFHQFDGWYHTLAVVSNTEPDLTLRWGASVSYPHLDVYKRQG